jgi:diacylglycerol kinase (ATP)
LKSCTLKSRPLKKIAFIVRGTLKNPDKFRAGISYVFQSEFEIFLKFTRRSGHAIEIVEQLAEQGIDYLVAVGGDGTLSEVVNGLMLAPAEARERIVLVAFPRGSGNDFSRTAGKIKSLEHLHRCIKNNQTRMIDVVKATWQQNGIDMIRYYDNSFDIGLGGLVCKLVNRSGKHWGSNFTYFSTIIKSFLTFKRIPVELISDSYTFQGKVLLLVLNNGKYFGSGLCVAPNAQIDDGLINLVIARKINITQFLRYIPELKKGKAIKHREVIYGKLSSCTVTSPMTDCPIEMDGEVIGQVPLKIEIVPHATKLLKIES